MRRLSLALLAAFALASAPSSGDDGKKPTQAEWEKADELKLARPTTLCSAKHVRNWVRLECNPGPTIMGIRVVGGDAAGVELGDRKLTAEEKKKIDPNMLEFASHGVLITFPTRPGDRRVITIEMTTFEGRYTVGEDTLACISELWLPDQTEPTIVID